MARDAFTFFASFRTATAKLDDATRLAVYDAIMDYALFDEEPVFDNVVAEAIFALVRPNVDASNKKRDSGAKGGSSVKAEELASAMQALGKHSASTAEAQCKQSASTMQAQCKHPSSDKDIDIDITPPISPPRGGGATYRSQDNRRNRRRSKLPCLNYAQHTDSSFSLDDISLNLDEVTT